MTAADVVARLRVESRADLPGHLRIGQSVARGRDHVTRAATVCSGNICRSVMAAVVFAHHLPEIEWESAGVAPHGPRAGADPQAVAVLRRRGYPAPVGHRCRGVSNRLLGADLILTMDFQQRAALLALGVPAERVHVVTAFDPAAPDEDVVNPWGYPDRIFDTVLTLFERCVPALREEVSGR